jgi:hypothetical protein
MMSSPRCNAELLVRFRPIEGTMNTLPAWREDPVQGTPSWLGSST